MSSNNNNLYILVIVDYVSKWVDGQTFPTIDAKVVNKFLKKNIFTRFGTLRAIISNEGLDFCNKALKALFVMYEVMHKVATTYYI